MIAEAVNQIGDLHQLDNSITNILHGSKNVFIKKRYLNTRSDYQRYFVINSSKENIKSQTILYNETTALRRFYTCIPPFLPSDAEQSKIEEFRNYVVAMNEDVIDFLAEKITILKEPEDPLALYIIPELISNAVKSNYFIEKKLLEGNNKKNIKKTNMSCMLEVVCLANRKMPDYVDVIMRNYAPFNAEMEKRIKEALQCRWTKRIKLEKEKYHRDNPESSAYGLPSINNAIQKFYNGELSYDGYDDSYADFGAYQFTMRLPKESVSFK